MSQTNLPNRRPKAGVSRRVFFQAWCHRHHMNLADWKGPERDNRSMAEYDRAAHEIDSHGGRQTRDEEKAS